MVPLKTMLTSHYANTSANGINNQKTKLILHLITITVELRVAVVPLMTPLALSNTDDNNNGIKWPKKSCCSSFQLSQPKQCNDTTDDDVGICNTDADKNGIKLPKSHVTPHWSFIEKTSVMQDPNPKCVQNFIWDIPPQ